MDSRQQYAKPRQLERIEWLEPEPTGQVVRDIRAQARAFCEDHTLGLLYELAKGLRNRPSTEGYVVELGTMQGGSACALAMGVRDCGRQVRPVIAVDCYGWPNPELPKGMQHTPNTFDYIAARETFWKMDLAWKYVCQVVTESDTFPRLWNRPIRVLFIDTSHLYDMTLREIRNHLPYMVDDSWIVFDDYDSRTVWGEGVIPAVNQWLAEERDWHLTPYGGDGTVAVHLEKCS